MEKNNNDITSVGVSILFEDTTSKTYHVSILDNNTNPPSILSTVGVFNFIFDSKKSNTKQMEEFNKKIEKILEFRLKFQDQINIDFENIIKMI